MNIRKQLELEGRKKCFPIGNGKQLAQCKERTNTAEKFTCRGSGRRTSRRHVSKRVAATVQEVGLLHILYT